MVRSLSILKFALFLAGLGFSILFFVTLKLHFDNTQMLDRAFKLLDTGVWVHHGNAATGMGFVPGTFLTFVTAMPMVIYDSPYSAMAVIALFHIASLLFILSATRPFDRSLVSLLLLLYWLNPWRVEQSELYNPGYLFFFAGAHLLSSMRMRVKSFGWTLFHVLTLGFCAQVHFSAIILIFLSALLLYRREIEVHWGAFALGSALIIGSLIPFFIELAQAPTSATGVSGHIFWGKNLILVFPVLKAIVYWVRYGSTDFARHIFTELDFSWIRSDALRAWIEYPFTAIKLALAAVTFFFSAHVNFKVLRKEIPRLERRRPPPSQEVPNAEAAFDRYFALLFVAMALAAALSPVEFNHWHLVICFPAVSILIAREFDRFLSRLDGLRARVLVGFMTLCFSAHNLFAAFGSRSHSLGVSYGHQVDAHYGRTSGSWRKFN